MCASSQGKLISPVPGSLRSGTSATWMWPMRGSSRSMVLARSPSTICMWNTSYCSCRLSAPAASMATRGLRRTVEEETRDGARVARLGKQRQSGSLQLARGVAQIFHQRLLGFFVRQRLGPDTGQRIQPRAAGRLRILDGAVHAFAEFVRALRLAGDAAVALGRVARRQVVQHHFDAGGLCALRDLLRAAERIRELVFDVTEAGFRGGGEALGKRQLREQQREVGGDFRHRVSIARNACSRHSRNDCGRSPGGSGRSPCSSPASRSASSRCLPVSAAACCSCPSSAASFRFTSISCAARACCWRSPRRWPPRRACCATASRACAWRFRLRSRAPWPPSPARGRASWCRHKRWKPRSAF